MRGYYLFNYQSSHKQRVVVLFCATTEPSKAEISSRLREYCDTRLPPDQICVLAPVDAKDSVGEAVQSPEFKDRLRAYTRHQDPPPVYNLYFNLKGEVKLPEDTELPDLQIQELKRWGLMRIFEERGGLLKATPEYHYVKPSGGHCDKFIRAANTLIHGAEIHFVAFCCLKYVGDQFEANGLQHIYCDTGAIHSLALAIVALRDRLSTDSSAPTVDSFRSYEGVETFEFQDPDDSLVLISASTSGGLAKRVRNLNPAISKSQIVTVFYLGKSTNGHVVLNLLKSTEGVGNFEPVTNYASSETCHLCQNHSTPVPITGDQFLPQSLDPQPVIIRARDAPAWLNAFVLNYHETDVIRANFSLKPGGNKKPIFLSVGQLVGEDRELEDNHFGKRLARLLDQSVPLNLTRVVYLNDWDSKEMAERIQSYAHKRGVHDIDIISLSDIEDNIDAYKLTGGATIVVASVVATGHNLLTASQVLRLVQKNGAITYLVGIARMPTKSALRQLRGNLTYGERPGDYGFFLVDAVNLPLESPQRDSPWERETRMLMKLISSKGTDAETVRALRERKATIDKATSRETRGLRDELFLCSVGGSQLSLRPGFAFYDFEYRQGAVSQADVFFTMLAILHNLRTDRSKKRSLQQEQPMRTLLSPLCFERFNDGIIQSAMLRAALPPELDYSLAPEMSDQMRRFLTALLRNADGESGEAVPEFLLALASGKLTLTDNDLHALARSVEWTYADSPIASTLWDFIGGRLS